MISPWRRLISDPLNLDFKLSTWYVNNPYVLIFFLFQCFLANDEFLESVCFSKNIANPGFPFSLRDS